MRPSRPALAATLVPAVALGLAACSSPDDAPETPETSAATDAAGGECSPETLPTLTEGTLTVAAGEPYEPWYVGEPTSGEGFESALVYAVASELGYAEEDVEWVTVTFEQIISPAIKPFDIAAYQTTITEERAEAVDFSSPYLTSRQGVIVADEGDFAGASTLADLEGARVGVTASQTSLDAAEAAWGDAVEIVPFNAAGDGMTALSSGTIDAMVMDVDQGVAASTVYFPDTQVIGTLPATGEPEQLGLVLDKDSELTDCVSQAVEALEADGTLAELRTEWLKSDDVPELS
ncbi:transporter substrate-binding domain-containing protein [Isoptericola variabilis]|uniref:ABC-type transporter, periplasmic subunit family 3 n=1 Tax=Isoptericola variabilis (strain 225) TaxID=743718 RepID=F6FXC5_ISOV2|nr:transporter substrate-binding domain-containing protein [Isoptericola variabilis]AEG43628.1 ABC-type transporter, periplasmic subunit family 3 [Isoptericola variabilis 225]TWH32002.1 polar amino acid transport system substrate-binding protein [Isoptericola variabilis J7]